MGAARTIPLGDGVRSSIYVNLLTEDNLPYYTDTSSRTRPKGHPIREWTCQWTMEENRHAMVMRDWVHISRCINPTLLEDGRRVQMQKGEVPQPGHLRRADRLRLVPGARHPDRAPQHRREAAQGRQDRP